MQSMYSTAHSVEGEVLPFCKEAVSVFYSHSQLDNDQRWIRLIDFLFYFIKIKP